MNIVFLLAGSGFGCCRGSFIDNACQIKDQIRTTEDIRTLFRVSVPWPRLTLLRMLLFFQSCYVWILNILTLLQIPSTSFLYLKASAVADILSILAFLPFVVRHAKLHNTSSYPAMFYHAHLELPIVNGVIAASAFCIVAMTVDRYLSVCHPITFFNSSDSKQRTLLIITGLYSLAAIILAPSALQKTLVFHPDNSTTGGHFDLVRNTKLEDENFFQVYVFLKELFTKFLPVLVLIAMNFAMIRKLKFLDKQSMRRSIRHHPGARDRSPREDRSRISALLYITTITFLICNIPAAFLSLFVKYLPEDSTFWQCLRAIANISQTTSYLCNFWLYALCSSEYREAFKKLVGYQHTRLMKLVAFLKSSSSCRSSSSPETPEKKSSNIPLVDKNKSSPTVAVYREDEAPMNGVAI